MQTTVMAPGPTQFDMTGQVVCRPLHAVDESISAGLAQRLARYAHQRFSEAGFDTFLREATVEVYTVDGDEKPTDRSYCVRYRHAKGGYLELIGVLTRHGWPSLDHGFAIGQD